MLRLCCRAMASYSRDKTPHGADVNRKRFTLARGSTGSRSIMGKQNKPLSPAVGAVGMASLHGSKQGMENTALTTGYSL